ncbi:MAG TPA: polysaccharide biosynthesis/export family protein [Puia sp.]|nr:polysaccharide biosynthesis/export family protein [Puia sp.]
MMQILFSRLKFLSIGGLGPMILAVMISSCGNTRQLVYMQGKFDTARLSQIPFNEAVIQKGDLLSIIVYSDNPSATALYNQSVIIAGANVGGGNTNPGGGTGSTSGALMGVGSPTVPGYLVDEEGNIQFQSVGILHVEGLTKAKLKELLDSKLKAYLNNPYYGIRFLNYRFTMLGEVTRPGIFNIPGERISLLDALGLAGDLTFFGRRDNVLVIRETNGKREFARLDLTKPEILASPYFYLQQSDVVVVEPTRKKIAANDQITARNVAIGVSIVSALAIIYSIFRN